MLKKVIFLSIVFLNLIIINSNISAQTESSKNLKKNIFSGNIMGTSSILGISYQRFLGKKVALEFGVGLIGIGTGLTIYPKGLTTSGTRFYTGIKLNSFVLVDVGGGTAAYIPLGVTFFTENNWIFGFDIGPARGKLVSSNFGGEPSQTTYFYGFGNLRIGMRF